MSAREMVFAPIGIGTAPAPCPDMPIDAYITTLPVEHREAVERARADSPLTPEDGDKFLKIVHWITWAPMSEDDKDRFTLEMLAENRKGQAWGAVR